MVAWTLVSESNQYVATNAIEDYPICLCFIVLLIFDFFLLRFILDLHIDISFFSISYSSQAIFSNYFHLNWANFFPGNFEGFWFHEKILYQNKYTHLFWLVLIQSRRDEWLDLEINDVNFGLFTLPLAFCSCWHK